MSLVTQKFQKDVHGFSRECRAVLLSYPFPGNVRELRNIVEFAVNICQESTIQPAHLPAYLFDPPSEPWRTPDQPSSAPAGEERPSPADAATWPDMERQMILDALYRAKGRKSRAAELLGWGRSTLWRKMKRYEIDE